MKSMGAARVCLALGVSFGALGCDDDTEPGGGGTGGEGGCTTDCPQDGGGGAGAAGGAGGTGGGGGFVPFEPSADDVQFQAVTGIPVGEWLLYNDWNPSPNEVLLSATDGSGETVIFEAYRIWSMGASRNGRQIAFSAGDPDQALHYGVTIGDAIQPTFLYDVELQTAVNLTYGNLNDECHRFSGTDQKLYLCRRYDFSDDAPAKGYRIGVLELATKAFTWLTDEDAAALTLNPEPKDTDEELYFSRIEGSTRTLAKIPLPAAEPEETFREDAGNPVIAPDKVQIAYIDYANEGALLVYNLSTRETSKVAAGPAVSSVAWSPDSTRIAFLRNDPDNNCSHVDMAHADGSDPEPVRIIDCAQNGRFITELAWVTRPN